ncbi:MAG: hypothetical protein KC505_09365, partial [Myxococcales bacterium]|nr:hypothetical protein [Myxococcales bacterium]
ITLMNSVFMDARFKDEINSIIAALSLTRSAIERAFLDYNIDVFNHDNSIYKETTIRAVLHLHNLIAGSWHISRQEAVCQLINLAQPRSAIDLGFGVPSRYVFELLKDKNFQLTMCDYQHSAITFAEVLLHIWNPNWRSNIKLICKNIEEVQQCVSDYDLYISLHSIEHVTNPTQCMLDYIKFTANNARFLLEIPIGPITPEHNIEWATVLEAQKWINELGLKIIHERFTKVNPYIDLFAEPHEYNYGGYLLLCEKRL